MLLHTYYLFHVAIHITLNGFSNSQTRVAFVYLSYRVEVRDIGVGQVGEPVKHRQVVGWEGRVFSQDHAPAVPWEKFNLIESSHVTDKVTFDEINPAQVENPKFIRVGLSATAHLPCRAADNELVARDVKGVK